MTAPADPTTIPDEVLALLRQVYTDEGALIWWTTPNHTLWDASPADNWAHGDDDKRRVVLGCAERLTGDLNG